LVVVAWGIMFVAQQVLLLEALVVVDWDIKIIFQ
jgi:hypothetical protein